MAAKMIDLDTSQIERYQHHLRVFNKRALPIANRSALNSGAFDAQHTAKVIIDKKMINRNKWTKQSIRVDKARGSNIRTQVATVGSTLDYMETQEFGGTKRKSGKEGVRMTTSYASGEGMQSRPRRRLARKPNKIRNIQLKNVSKRGTSKRQQALIAIRVAAKKGRKFVFLDMPWTKGKKGIYKITGGKESKRGGKTPIKIRMVHSLKKQSVTIKPNPWLGPAVKQVRKRMPNHFAGALRFQINRMRLFTSV